MERLVYGFGVNDLGYKVSGKVGKGWGVICPYYEVWQGILSRTCKSTDKRPNSYKNASIHPDWKYASVFKAWMEEQPWEGNSCDKDILVRGNLEYGPLTCKFVPTYVNTSLISGTRRNKLRTNLPKGVYYREKRNKPYKASVTKADGSHRFLGYYSTAEEAHKVWQLAKAESIRGIIDRYSKEDCYDKAVAHALSERIRLLRNDAREGKETEKL